ncbi:MAG: HAD family phosphatase [Clostridia bacterium]|nr:HAD family phosphatase [Clostridia bacterium]
MYRLIAIDIDGTLLNSNSELTERTKTTLKKATDNGIYVVLTSGRMSSVIQNFCNQIGADQFFIAENGASMIDLQRNEVIYTDYMSKETVLEIVDLCMENNIYYMVYTNKELIVKDLKHMALFFHKQNYNPNARIKTILAGRDYIESIDDNFTKMMICDEDRAIYNSIVNKLQKLPDIDVTPVPHISSKKIKFGDEEKIIEYSYADIAAKGANKWTAIERLIRALKIDASEVIAIGDNINDIPMVKNAGLGVAMANGADQLKELADVIAPSNDEDGVAEIVEKYIL